VFKGNLEEALSSIEANVVLMPGINDLYFPPEENLQEVKYLKKGSVEIIPSNYGHYAGAGKCKEDLDLVNNQISKLLSN
jgi:homoserine O-acetyltransferase